MATSDRNHSGPDGGHRESPHTDDRPTGRTRGRPRGRPRIEQSEKNVSLIQALDRGIRLLRTLAQEDQATLGNVAVQADMTPSTAYRILMTLQKHDFVTFDETTQEWRIGIEAFRVGSRYLVGTNLVEAARPMLHQLMTESNETANLAIAEKGHVVFISQVETHNPIRAFFRSGTRSSMHSSGIGKALLAHLPRTEVETIVQRHGLPRFTEKTLTETKALFDNLDAIRSRGWSLDDEERHEGMRCVAAPVFDSEGSAIAGLSISGPTIRFPDALLAELGSTVAGAAEQLTQRLGGSSSNGSSRSR